MFHSSPLRLPILWQRYKMNVPHFKIKMGKHECHSILILSKFWPIVAVPSFWNPDHKFTYRCNGGESKRGTHSASGFNLFIIIQLYRFPVPPGKSWIHHWRIRGHVPQPCKHRSQKGHQRRQFGFHVSWPSQLSAQFLAEILTQLYFPISYWFRLIRWISWIQLEPVEHNSGLCKVFRLSQVKVLWLMISRSWVQISQKSFVFIIF